MFRKTETITRGTRVNPRGDLVYPPGNLKSSSIIIVLQDQAVRMLFQAHAVAVCPVFLFRLKEAVRQRRFFRAWAWLIHPNLQYSHPTGTDYKRTALKPANKPSNFFTHSIPPHLSVMSILSDNAEIFPVRPRGAHRWAKTNNDQPLPKRKTIFAERLTEEEHSAGASQEVRPTWQARCPPDSSGQARALVPLTSSNVGPETNEARFKVTEDGRATCIAWPTTQPQNESLKNNVEILLQNRSWKRRRRRPSVKTAKSATLYLNIRERSTMLPSMVKPEETLYYWCIDEPAPQTVLSLVSRWSVFKTRWNRQMLLVVSHPHWVNTNPPPRHRRFVKILLKRLSLE
jgi:hypothetical protein